MPGDGSAAADGDRHVRTRQNRRIIYAITDGRDRCAACLQFAHERQLLFGQHACMPVRHADTFRQSFHGGRLIAAGDADRYTFGSERIKCRCGAFAQVFGDFESSKQTGGATQKDVALFRVSAALVVISFIRICCQLGDEIERANAKQFFSNAAFQATTGYHV